MMSECLPNVQDRNLSMSGHVGITLEPCANRLNAKLGIVVFIHFQTFVIPSGDTRHLLAHFIIDASDPSIIFMGPVYSHHGLFRLLLRALFRPSRATMGHFRKQESKMVS